MLKIGIDIDDCITYCPDFFIAMTNAMNGLAEIHIITNREQTQESEANTRNDLDELGIYYHHLIITPDTSISHIASAFNKPIITIHENNNDSYELFSPTSMLNKTFFSQEKNNLRGYDIQALIDHTSHLINKISKNENSRH